MIQSSDEDYELRSRLDGDVIGWRYHRLRESGYSAVTATLLATNPDVDLHRAAELVAKGCPHALAVSILA